MLWTFLALRDLDALASLQREGERIDTMVKTAIAIGVAMSGKTDPMDDVRREFEGRLERIELPAEPTDDDAVTRRWAHVIEKQNALWADYDAAHPPKPPVS